MMKITTINTTTLFIQWTPSFLWEGYTINYYIINVHRVNGSISLHPPSPINRSDEYFTYFRSTIPLPPCTQLNVSITAVSVQYGESDPISALSGFDTSMIMILKYSLTKEIMYIFNVLVPGIISQELITTNVYFRSNGTPLVDLKFQVFNIFTFSVLPTLFY